MPFWYQPLSWWCWGLYPFAVLLRLISFVRRSLYKHGLLKCNKNPLPVIVVGNISVGGNGKTPFVIWLCELLKEQGYKPGIVSRGYGGKSDRYPLLVDHQVTGKEAGDEPIMLFKRLAIPIVVDPIRANAAQHLYQSGLVDIIITDDGLQHYALHRDIEIVVVDGQRRMGNEHLMPMGPLREPMSRLQEVDFIINNGAHFKNEITMQFISDACVRVDGEQGTLTAHQPVNACAAIGYPQRFFNSLEKLNYQLKETVSFADHHAYKVNDFSQFDANTPLVMTEKDAVKCLDFAQPNWWYLPIKAQLPASFEKQLLKKIKEIQ